ncbi:MAG: type III secretion inner membrane ring lipoprotein SctJ [Planctomycetota bacterium]|jgi:type III secretion protein J|nr:type III secretion inner membrane ring lipoprotein SctJ [Planctomycetota bacterium]
MPIVRGFFLAAMFGLSLSLAGCQTRLFGELSEKEANEILAALLEASLQAEKRAGEEGTYVVFVEESDFALAVRIMEDRALPARHYDNMGEVFGKGAMFSTPLEENARYLYAMQESLSQTIAQIDGVLAARVHLVLPEIDQLGREIRQPSAAVFVKYIDDEAHDPGAYRAEIRRLVAASVPNLDPERIVVTFFPAPPQARLRSPAPPGARVFLGLRLDEANLSRFWLILGIFSVAGALLGGGAVLVAGRRKAGR